MILLDRALIVAGILLLAGVLASKASSRMGIPALLLFLLTGMLAGTEGIGGIPFEDAQLTQTLGIVALSFILFSGGLETNWPSVSRVLWRGLSLSTMGVACTAAVAGACAKFVLGFSWLEGLLLGSIISSTDAAAVFAVLRSRGVSLKGSNKPLLELESGSNDPMAVFLTLAIIRLMKQPDAGLSDLLLMFILQMIVGAASGVLLGKATIYVLNRIKLETEGLYPVLTLSIVLLTYGVASVLRGNGFLAVYLAGIVLGNGDFIHKRSLVRFHDGLAWLMQITMFVTLGLLVFPSHLLPVAAPSLLISAALMFLARPIGVFAGLLLARLGMRHKLLLSWVGLRGAVPIVLATFPFVAQVEHADIYFNVVFFVVLSSVLLQGTTISLVARRLGLEAPLSRTRLNPLEYVRSGRSRNDLVEITVPEASPVIGRQVVDLRLPKSALIVLLGRDDDFLVPRGSTVLQADDVLLVLTDDVDLETIKQLVQPGAAPPDSSDA